MKFVDTFAPQTAKLYPQAKENEISEWETMFNRRLGPAVRLACYFHLLGLPMCYSLFTYRVSLLERVITYPLMPLITFLIRKALRIHDKNYARSAEYIRDIFRQVSERLSDGRPFLCGGDFTAADLTFAALGAPSAFLVVWPLRLLTRARPVPVVLAPNYGGQLPTRDMLPPDMVALVDELRATAAGSHILRLYEHERLKRV